MVKIIEEMIELKKKIMFVISAGMIAYEVYDRVKRTKKNSTASGTDPKVADLEKELAKAKRTQSENMERRRMFKR